jgi:arylsulfatase
LGWGAASLPLAGLAQSCKKEDIGEEGLPNIVLIFIDDMGYADVGCYGAKGYLTPNIDGMAEQGMRFTSFYVAQAVCSASRAALLTGCYPNRVGIFGAYNDQAKVGINPDEETIAEVLKKKGYATACFGKWHLGHHHKFLPLQNGFDEYLGLPYSNDMWPVEYDGTALPEGHSKLRYPPLPLIEGNEKVEEIRSLEDQDTLTTRYTERAVQFIEKNKDQPFFLYVPHTMVHTPLGVSDKFKGKSEQGMYGDTMMEVDWSVGEILKTLAKHKLENKTLVIFTSDNGPWMNFGKHAGSAGPFREGKGTSWEGGVRVPCIMRWPGHIPAGTECSRMAATMDVLPTLATITGAPLPAHKIDGVNILPLLMGDPGANPREHLFYYYGKQLQAVRQGKWKLHFPHGYRSYEGVEPGKDGLPGPYAHGETGLELYDLENDISEKHDVAAKYPDVVERLTALGDRARKELGDKELIGEEVRPPGSIESEADEEEEN